MPYPGLLHPEPLLTCTFAGNTQTQFWLNLCGVLGSWCVKHLFEPSKRLWWGLILNMISPLLPSSWMVLFALGYELTFFGGIQHSPVDGCSAASCNCRVLTGEDECMSFYSAMLRTISHAM